MESVVCMLYPSNDFVHYASWKRQGLEVADRKIVLSQRSMVLRSIIQLSQRQSVVGSESMIIRSIHVQLMWN